MFSSGIRWMLCLLLPLLLLPTAYADGGVVFKNVALKRVFNDVSFQRPLAFVPAPNKSKVWYIVEQSGRVLRLDGQGAKLKSTVFIDIRDRVESGPNEAGLLGLSFDPKFSNNGKVYLSYTYNEAPPSSMFSRLMGGGKKKLISTLSRFLSRNGGLTLDASSEHKLLQVEQPYSNHNGGDIHFGPDGFLYYGLGDGGSGGDPQGNGQDTQTLLGSMLRIDVSAGEEYKIPVDNPFVNGGGRAEIFAYGLRNPWRWSFDRNTGELWVADVGQNIWEEVNRIKPGGNYGWNLREGKHCYSGKCNQAGLIDPVAEYSHDEGCSITGGYVYRGEKVPALRGTYLYADYCSGTIWGLDADKKGSVNSRVLLDTDLNISSFGEDNSGEIYVIDLKGGIYKLIQK